MKKVLIVTSEYPTHQHPLDGLNVRDHARAAAHHNDVHILHIDRGHRRRERPAGTLPVTRTAFPPMPGKPGQLLALLAVPFLVAWILARHRFSPDVVHSHFHLVAPHGWLAAKTARARWVHTERSSAFESRRLHCLQHRLAYSLLPKADRVLPLSKHLQAVLEKAGINGRYQVVWNAVDTDLFHPPASRRIPASRVRFLAVGRFDPTDIKNYQGLLQATRTLPDDGWTLTVIGSGPSILMLQMATFGDQRIVWSEAVPQAEIAEAMRDADWFVHAAPIETFSAVVAQALVTGLPVIGRNTGAIAELVEATGGGLIVDNDDEMASAMQRAAAREVTVDRDTATAKARELLSMDRLAHDLDKVYMEVTR